ncbi:Nse4 C-terminal-domain-containing protein, partial [Sordaria brevicollis]
VLCRIISTFCTYHGPSVTSYPRKHTMSDEDIYDASPPRSRNLEVRNKAKRTSDGHEGPAATRRRIRDPSPPNLDANGDLDEYDPAQSMQERRQIQRKLREMQKQMRENPEQFMQDGDPEALINYFDQSDDIMRHVKQTNEAAIDARGLVIAADLSARRIQRLTAGNLGNGIDVDEFVSKCITYMRHGRGFEDDDAPELTSTQRHRRRPGRAAADLDDEDDVGDEGDMLNWTHLGRFAAVPSIRRPALPGFLSGPLSVEKKVRRTTQRNAAFKINSLIEVRPQELRAEDLKKSDKNDLPSICRKILEQLKKKQNDAQDTVESLLDKNQVDDAEQEFVIMDKYALLDTGGIDLLRFVINPHSFGQTVENMFYVSFLLREGSLKLEFDSYGRPSLSAQFNADEQERAQGGRQGTTRHQAIMSIDMDIWNDIKNAYNIKEPMIPHREEEAQQGPGAQGWYS